MSANARRGVDAFVGGGVGRRGDAGWQRTIGRGVYKTGHPAGRRQRRTGVHHVSGHHVSRTQSQWAETSAGRNVMQYSVLSPYLYS